MMISFDFVFMMSNELFTLSFRSIVLIESDISALMKIPSSLRNTILSDVFSVFGKYFKLF